MLSPKPGSEVGYPHLLEVLDEGAFLRFFHHSLDRIDDGVAEPRHAAEPVLDLRLDSLAQPCLDCHKL